MKKNLAKEYLDIIRDEVSILSMLHHPNIVQYVESFEDKKQLFIVMEHCGGGTLLDLLEAKLKKKQIFSELEVAKIIYGTLKTIHHIHVNGIVHRDIKPENIMFDDKGNIKIIDFGLSKIVNEFHRLKTKVGSMVYTAPEVLQ